jgi:hypothetical protein
MDQFDKPRGRHLEIPADRFRYEFAMKNKTYLVPVKASTTSRHLER